MAKQQMAAMPKYCHKCPSDPDNREYVVRPTVMVFHIYFLYILAQF